MLNHDEIDRPRPIDNGLRSAWQWLAMGTMAADHVGYLYYQLDFLRYAGRLAMPLYAMLFVMTIRSGHVRPWRVLALAAISQVPYLLLFHPGWIWHTDLNIIFGFLIFYWLTVAVEKRCWWGIVLTATAITLTSTEIALTSTKKSLPVCYGWYLYGSMAAFYWLDGNRRRQRGVFAGLTVLYTYFRFVWRHDEIYFRALRQLLAIGVPFIQGIKARRPNKYLYRYFYPGHLFVLVIVDLLVMGYIITPFGTFGPKASESQNEWEYRLYDDTFETDEEMWMYDVSETN